MNEPTELNERILEALAVAVEVTGATLTPPAIKIMVAKLQQHPEAAVLKAIDRAMEEVHGRLSLASILERLKADREDDGRPSAEEAWAQVGTDDERLTLVTTDEAMRACGEVRLLIEQGDMVAARMSFKDAYARIVSENRAHGIPVKWMASLGFDNAGQVRALTAAVQSGKLDAQYAADLIGVEPAVLLGKAQPLALPAAAPSSAPQLPAGPQSLGTLIAARPVPGKPPGRVGDLLKLMADGGRPTPCGADGCDGFTHGTDKDAPACPQWEAP